MPNDLLDAMYGRAQTIYPANAPRQGSTVDPSILAQALYGIPLQPPRALPQLAPLPALQPMPALVPDAYRNPAYSGQPQTLTFPYHQIAPTVYPASAPRQGFTQYLMPDNPVDRFRVTQRIDPANTTLGGQQWLAPPNPMNPSGIPYSPNISLPATPSSRGGVNQRRK